MCRDGTRGLKLVTSTPGSGVGYLIWIWRQESDTGALPGEIVEAVVDAPDDSRTC